MEKFKLIILGFGPTGLYAAYYASIKKIDCLVLEINSTFGGAPARLFPDKPLYDIPGHIEITGAELVNNMHKQAESVKNYEIKYNVEVVEIVPLNDSEARYKLIDSNKNEYYCDNIMFATGYGAFEFVQLDCDVGDSIKHKIHYFVENSNLYNNKKVVICGGGDSAIDYANKLKNTCDVSLIHRREDFRAHADNVEKILNSDNICVYKDKTITRIDDNNLYMRDNKTSEQHVIGYDYILVLYGTTPKANNIKIDNLYNKVFKIPVDSNLESIQYQGIYACGLATSFKQEQTILTGITDAIKVISKISKE